MVRGEERTPGGAFDRSVEPPYGASPRVRAPEVWRETLANGLSVLGVEDRETPMVQFELRLRGGMLLEEPGRTGVANLLAETMLEGTANRSPEELEQAIDLLGASLSVSGGSTGFTVSGSVLARNYNETMALVEEILLEPRFDPERFELARQRVMNVIRRLDANPSAIASQAFDRLLYGDHILAGSRLGSTRERRRLHPGRSPRLPRHRAGPGRGGLPRRGSGLPGRGDRPARHPRRAVGRTAPRPPSPIPPSGPATAPACTSSMSPAPHSRSSTSAAWRWPAPTTSTTRPPS